MRYGVGTPKSNASALEDTGAPRRSKGHHEGNPLVRIVSRPRPSGGIGSVCLPPGVYSV